MIILSALLFTPVSLVLDNIAGKELSFLTYYLLAMGIPFLIAHQQRKKRTHVSGYNFEFSSPKIIALVSFSLIGIQIGIIMPLVSLIPMPDFVKEIFQAFAARDGVLSFIAIVFAAPILEELIFRGIILNGLLKKYSPLNSIILSSVLFGIVHLNPWQFIGALIIGIFSGWVYYRTEKLTLSIIIHSVNNLLAFGSMNFVDTETMMDLTLLEFYGGSLNFIIVTGGAISLGVICLYFLRNEFQNVRVNNGSTQSILQSSHQEGNFISNDPGP
jgi:uncharacterized protein